MGNDETVVEVLSQGEEKLMKILEVIAKMEVDAATEDAEASEGYESPSGDLPAYNIRVALPSQEDEGMSESDVDEEEGDDVPDREQMKKMSNLMLEKATKKTKKRGGRRRRHND